MKAPGAACALICGGILACVVASASLAQPAGAPDRKPLAETLADARAGDEQAWRQLVDRLEHPTVNHQQRDALLQAIVNEASTDALGTLLDRCVRWTEPDSRERESRGWLAWQVFDALPGSRREADPVLRPRVLRFYQNIIDWDRRAERGRVVAAALQRSTIDAREKSALALRVLRRQSGYSLGLGSPFIDLLHRDDLDALRAELGRWTMDDPQTYPLAASVALADTGDQSVRALLSRQREAAAAHLLDAGLDEERRAHWNWLHNRIVLSDAALTLQESEQSLLEGIGAADIALVDPRNREVILRVWAVERAVELGIARDKIRASILRYARFVEVEVSADDNPKRGRMLRNVYLSDIKQAATRLAVLSERDLPDVQIIQRHED